MAVCDVVVAVAGVVVDDVALLLRDLIDFWWLNMIKWAFDWFIPIAVTSTINVIIITLYCLEMCVMTIYLFEFKSFG